MFITALHRREYNQIITRGLVGWWPLDEGSGTTTLDHSGNGYNASISGATWVASAFPKGGYALNFDGSDDEAALSGPTLAAAVSVTMCCWVDLDTVGDYEAMICVNTSNGGYARMVLGMRVGKWNFRFRPYDRENQAAYDLFSASNISTGTPTHVAATFNSVSGVHRIYVNGSEDNTLNQGTGILGTSAPTFIGLGRAGVSPTFYRADGRIADARIYISTADSSGELSAAEIAAIAAGQG